jgi:hypothetical protein
MHNKEDTQPDYWGFPAIIQSIRSSQSALWKATTMLKQESRKRMIYSRHKHQLRGGCRAWDNT